MSNARSPREVCSTTIGISGLMRSSLLAAGGPQLLSRTRAARPCRASRCSRAPAASSCRDRLDLGRDPVDRLASCAGRRARGRRRRASMNSSMSSSLSPCSRSSARMSSSVTSMPSLSTTASSTSSRATDCAASSRSRCSSASARLARSPGGTLPTSIPRDSKLTDEGVEQLARPHLDDEPGRLDLRRLHELVDRGRRGSAPSISSSSCSRMLLLDVGAELVERVELRRGAREVVVERRQHLLVELLERDGRGAPRAVAELPDSTSLALAGEPRSRIPPSISSTRRSAPSSTT